MATEQLGSPVSFVSQAEDTQTEPSEGFVSLTDGPVVSNSTPMLNENFDISFTLAETAGAPRTFDQLFVQILNANNTVAYTIDTDPRLPVGQPVTFSANQSRIFTVSTFLDPDRGRTADTTYKARIMFAVDGGAVEQLGSSVSFYVPPPEPVVGFISLASGPTVSNTTPMLNENFDISFRLTETAGAPRTFDQLFVQILNANNTVAYTIDTDPRLPVGQPVTFSANQSRIFTVSTFLDPDRGRTADTTYKARIMFAVDGGAVEQLGSSVSFYVPPSVGQVTLTSGPKLSNSSPLINQNFNVSFTLTETAGVAFKFDRVQVHILNGSGEYLYTVDDDPRLPPLNSVTISANSSRTFVVTTYLGSAFGRTPGPYQAQVMIEVNRGGLGPMPGSSNPVSFNAR